MNLIIIGAGGFGREVAWIASLAGHRTIGYCDDSAGKRDGLYGGLPLLGTIEEAAATFDAPQAFHVAVGCNDARRSITERAEKLGWTPLTIVAPSAIVAPDVLCGVGSFIGADAVISVGCVIGRGVVLNHKVCVGHDVKIGDFSQLCPHAVVSGGCTIGKEALLGSNSTVIPCKTVGSGATLGAGALAIRDIAEHDSIVRLR